MTRRPGPSTRAVHVVEARDEPDVVPPLRRSVIGRFDTADRFARTMAGEEEGLLYGRIMNPSVAAAAAAVARLEGAPAGLLTASGMAAIHAAVLAHLPRGGRVVTSGPLYGNTLSLFRDVLGPRLGLALRSLPAGDLEGVRAACADGVDVLYAETVANPGVAVADIPALAAVARAAGGRLVVDNTIATPLVCRPLEHGAALVVHSATKFLNGHHDVLAGAVVGAEADVAPVAAMLVDTGGVCDPDSAWLLLRGMRTLSLRLDRQQANAEGLAEHLRRHPAVRDVPYPGLPGHRDHDLALRLLGGRAGAVLPVVLAGGRAAGEAAMDRVRLIERVTSLGGLSTGISHAASTSHRQLGPDELRAAGVDPGLVRIAVGCEDLEDLVDDLEQALRSPA